MVPTDPSWVGARDDTLRFAAGRYRAAGEGGVLDDRLVRRATVVAVAWLAVYAIATATIARDRLGAKIVGDVLYQIPVAAVAILSYVAARRSAGRRRAFWAVLTVSNGFWLLGELTWSAYDFLTEAGAPFPSIADLFYVTSYALVVPAVVLGFWGRRRERFWIALLDASVVTATIGVVGYELLIRPQLSGAASLATATGVAYPLLGVVILVVLASFVFSSHRRVPLSVTLVGTGFAASAITDAGYTYLVVLHEYGSGGWLNVGWQLEAVLLGLAALIAIRGREPTEREELFDRRWGLVLILSGAAAALGYAAIDGISDGRFGVASILVTAYAVVALVLRLRLTAYDVERVGRQLQEALERLQTVDGQRRGLLDATVRASELERSRVAAELHDRPIQRLTALDLSLERVRREISGLDTDGLEDQITAAQEQLRREIKGLRRLMTELRPPVLDEWGLLAAIRQHAEAVLSAAGIACTFSDGFEGRVDGSAETILYRVAQEALSNVVRHSSAREATVSLRADDRVLVLEIRDDGVGFDPEAPPATVADQHFGLMTMRERVEMAGGRFSVRSSPGSGTHVRASVPAALEPQAT